VAILSVSALERLLKRDGAITVVGLFVLWVLTWTYIVAGAGLGMTAWEMTRLVLLPQHDGAVPTMTMPGAEMAAAMTGWSPGYWALIIGMWWTMMVAMMIPSAAPTIFLYARVHQHNRAQGRLEAEHASTAAFVAGYFLTWLLFSVAAAVLQQRLESAGLISAMAMGSQVRWLSGTTLIATGLYQLSPLKNSCLSHCREPARFLSRHWRPGALGALRMGVVHGAYCIGCCWMLMALLFVGGVMNLVWIAVLSALILAEKVLAAGPWVGLCAGVMLVAWGAVLLLR